MPLSGSLKIKGMKALLIILIFLCGCRPLHKIQKKQYNDIIVADSTITQVIKKELKKQLTEVSTTVIEFEVADSVVPPVIVIDNKPIKVKQPVKRIIKREIKVKTDNTIEVDSTEHKQVIVIDKTETKVKTEEKPSNFVQGAWVIACILFMLIAFYLIKRRL